MRTTLGTETRLNRCDVSYSFEVQLYFFLCPLPPPRYPSVCATSLPFLWFHLFSSIFKWNALHFPLLLIFEIFTWIFFSVITCLSLYSWYFHSQQTIIVEIKVISEKCFILCIYSCLQNLFVPRSLFPLVCVSGCRATINGFLCMSADGFVLLWL